MSNRGWNPLKIAGYLESWQEGGYGATKGADPALNGSEPPRLLGKWAKLYRDFSLYCLYQTELDCAFHGLFDNGWLA